MVVKGLKFWFANKKNRLVKKEMTRGRPKKYQESELLDLAMRLLWREGVRGISLNGLAEEMGVSKPALASFFGCKDALIARSLEYYRDRYARDVRGALANAETVEDLARGYLTASVELNTRADTPPGCLLASTGSDCSAIRVGPIRETLDRLSKESLDALETALKRVGSRDPKGQARYLYGQAIALAMLARNGASLEELLDFVEIALRACE